MSLSDAERAAGLSEALPAGETILWQAKPNGRRLTHSVFHARTLLAYFLLAAVAIVALALRGGRPIGQAIAEATLLLPFALVAGALLGLIGRATARAATYTLTNRRLILHIGIAYEMTVSIPLSAINGAALRRLPRGHGDIVLTVVDAGNANYLALWPHARPGRFFPPQPMLRAIPDAEAAAEAIGDALVLFNAGGRRPAAPAPRAEEALAA